jgi:cobalamin biosynthesis protein CobD
MNTQAIIVLSLSFPFELVGEPPERVHPTALIGRLELKLEALLKRKKLVSKFWGFTLWLFVIGVVALTSYALLHFLKALPTLLYFVILAFLLKTSYALLTMERFVAPIFHALKSGDLVRARTLTQRIVRRETANLGEGHVCSAVIESISESLVDGFCSPLFFYSILGLVGALVYRAINTMDSMVGYKTEEYRELGFFSAKADTYANYLVARLVALLTVFSAILLRMDYKSAFMRVVKEARNTQSVNAGYPFSAFSGALRVKLEKLNSYTIGVEDRLPSFNDIKRSITLARLVAFLFVLLVVFPVTLFNWWFVWTA